MKGIVYGVGVVLLGAFYAAVIVHHRYGVGGLKRMLAVDSTVVRLVAISFAFGFALSPIYEVCKWFDATVKDWWASRKHGN